MTFSKRNDRHLKSFMMKRNISNWRFYPFNEMCSLTHSHLPTALFPTATINLEQGYFSSRDTSKDVFVPRRRSRTSLTQETKDKTKAT